MWVSGQGNDIRIEKKKWKIVYSGKCKDKWERSVIQNEDVKPLVPSIIYEGESTENLKSAIKIRTTARLSCKFQQLYSWFEEWLTGGSTILHRKMKSLCTFRVE